MDRQEQWMENRCGRITASELGNLTSASGKIIDGNLSFIRQKRWERRHGYALPVNAKQFDIGHETEPYIYDWAVKNLPLLYPELKGVKFLYAQNLPELPFWVPAEFDKFGASPDCFSEDESIVVEFKTLVGNDTKCFYMDEHTSYEEKKTAVFKEHGDQILGQFLSNSKVKTIFLVKYAPQLDDVIKDVDAPDAPWRGVVFRFDREDFVASIRSLKDRIELFDAFIDSDINPSEFKVGTWSLSFPDGKLEQTIEEKPKKK